MRNELDEFERAAREDPSNPDKVNALTESYRRTGWTFRGKNIATWVEQLRGTDWRAASEAGRALVRIGVGAVPSLIEVLADPNSGTRSYAARALGQIGRESSLAVSSLVQLTLNDPDWRARYAAATALGEIGPAAAQAIGYLRSARDPDSKVQDAIETTCALIQRALIDSAGAPDLLPNMGQKTDHI